MAMKRLNVCGHITCGYYKRAKAALQGLATIYPQRVSVNVLEHESKEQFQSWLEEHRSQIGAVNHKTSPVVWFDDGRFLGGCDDTLKWCRDFCSVSSVEDEHIPATDPWNPEHGFDYDLVVIGGGSGGLACSKEAQKLGARVAVLDYVKPSPHGSKWGLGGTCVNVGCIPKKLFHTGALMGEHVKESRSYGWEYAVDGAPAAAGRVTSVHNWNALRDRVQDHIKGLNFGYRVQLREKGVTYLNKLGKFIGPNQLECTDVKGKTQVISSARFVIATGGRPSPLQCPGGELAISSDDIFTLETPPGKTCVVGAGYVALECAGFINGLHHGEVAVMVRSKPLRTFDRDVVEQVIAYMKNDGIRILEGVLPAALEKQPNGKILVRFSTGEAEEFDTVLCAIGRDGDTRGLGLDKVNVGIEKNGKLVCVDEQTTTPHIYAIGDVVQGAPELTPSAILSGKLLARRLFGGSHEWMDYRNIATTVFTPLELGTVGLTEEQAKEKFGEENVECYISSFSPLEWSLMDEKAEAHLSCFAKIVVNKLENEKVIGLHIAAPNAGEIMQGFGVALKKGITYKDVVNTVGIHPTTAEEYTTMTITKSSGVSAAKSGC